MPRLYGPGAEPPPPLIASTDLSGLSTTDVEDRPVGKLFGALAESETGLIRYLDVSLSGGDRHVLVPIGHTRVDRDSIPPRVRLRAATYEDLMAVPQYDPQATQLDTAYQDELMQAHGQLFYGSHYYAHPAFDHSHLYAGEQPVEAAGAAEEAEPRLVPLSELSDYQVARGAVDIRGFSMEDHRGELVGEVRELLVDTGASTVRYVVVSLEEPARDMAIPVGYLEIDSRKRRTYTPQLSDDDLRVLPAYDPPLTRAEENRIQMSLEGLLSGERYFERPDFRRPLMDAERTP